MTYRIEFTTAQLQTLAQALAGTSAKINPQSAALARAQTDIHLTYTRDQIQGSEPPELTPPQRIVSMTIAGVRYTQAAQWRTQWLRIWRETGRSGPAQIAAVNIVSSQGQPLGLAVTIDQAVTTTPTVDSTAAPTSVYVTGAQGSQGVQGVQGQRGLDGRGIQSVSLDPLQNLIVAYTDGTQASVGNVTVLTPEFSAGTVTALPWGSEPTVAVTNISANSWQIDFGLVSGQNSENPVETTGSYADPSWITSLAGTKVTDAVLTTGSYSDPGWITTLSKVKVGLGNVTNESKATMFTDPQFTGTVTGVTADHVGIYSGTASYTWTTAGDTASITITDPRMTVGQQIWVTASGSTADSALGGDELEFDQFNCAGVVNAGSAEVWIKATGPVLGRRNFAWLVR